MRRAGGSERTNRLRLKCSDGASSVKVAAVHHSLDAKIHSASCDGGMEPSLEPGQVRGDPGGVGLAVQEEPVHGVELLARRQAGQGAVPAW